jgi:hypothetical protein
MQGAVSNRITPAGENASMWTGGKPLMPKDSNNSVTPKIKSTRARVDKRIDRMANDAAKKASKTEQNYDAKRGIFTK